MGGGKASVGSLRMECARGGPARWRASIRRFQLLDGLSRGLSLAPFRQLTLSAKPPFSP